MRPLSYDHILITGTRWKRKQPSQIVPELVAGEPANNLRER